MPRQRSRKVLDALAIKHDITAKDVTYATAYADDMLADAIYTAERELKREIEKVKTRSKLADEVCGRVSSISSCLGKRVAQMQAKVAASSSRTTGRFSLASSSSTRSWRSFRFGGRSGRSRETCSGCA